MRRGVPLLLLGMIAGGCPDPSGTSGNAVTGTTGTGSTDAQKAGAPTEMIGVKTAGAPSIQSGPMGFSVKEGEGVPLTGTISYTGSKSGKIRIDFLKMTSNQPPQLAHTVELPAWGEWTVSAPRGFGDVRIVGFLDQTGDGPSKDDPACAWAGVLAIGQDPITNVDLVLSDTPDLGDLTPGSQPPPGVAPSGSNAGAPAGPPPGTVPSPLPTPTSPPPTGTPTPSAPATSSGPPPTPGEAPPPTSGNP
jgi:hypothetical protein